MTESQKSFFERFKAKFTRQTIFQALLSVVIAFLLWAYALSSSDPLKTVLYPSVPVTLINTESLNASGLIIEDTSFTIDVRLYGSTIQVSRIKNNDIIAVANLASIKSAGTYSIEVSITGLPENISVTEISAKYISVIVREKTSEERSFEIETTGSPKDGYAVLSRSCDAEAVTLSGSETQINHVSSIRGSVSIAGIDADTNTYVELSAYDAEGKKIDNVELSPAGVNVNVTLGQKRAIDVMVQYKGEPASGASLKSVSISPSRINVIAKAATLDKYEYLNTEVLDITDRADSYTASVSVLLPEGMIAAAASTVTANVQIEPAAELSHKNVTLSEIHVRELAENLTYTLKDFSTLELTLSGSKADIEKISEENVSAYVEAAGLEAGEHTLMLHFVIPSGAALSSASIEKVTLVLAAKPTEPIEPTDPTDIAEPTDGGTAE